MLPSPHDQQPVAVSYLQARSGRSLKQGNAAQQGDQIMPAIGITLAAAKGGVGKSSLTLNLAGFLALEHGFKVLVVDTDSQSSSSNQFLPPETVDTLRTENSIAAIFDESCFADPATMIHKTPFEGIDFVPASPQLERFDLPEPHKTGELQFAMDKFVKDVGQAYQFVLFDTTPKMSVLPTWNCLLASHFAITPLVMEEDSIQSISGTDRIIRAAAERNHRLSFLGYVVNMLDKRTKWHAHNESLLRAVHGDRVFNTVVTNLTAFKEARGFRLPITAYPDAREAKKITVTLCKEILARAEKKLGEQQEKATQTTTDRRAA